jgi:hypothetical protein
MFGGLKKGIRSWAGGEIAPFVRDVMARFRRRGLSAA